MAGIRSCFSQVGFQDEEGVNRSTTQWSFLVPLIGGRSHIIPQLAVYTTYITLIYCLLGDYISPTTYQGNQKQLLNYYDVDNRKDLPAEELYLFNICKRDLDSFKGCVFLPVDIEEFLSPLGDI